MDRTSIKRDGAEAAVSTVVVSTFRGKVVITRRDGDRAPLVRRQPARDLEARARQVVRELAAEGYVPVA